MDEAQTHSSKSASMENPLGLESAKLSSPLLWSA
ncbi:hypothetical protein T12_12567 [Trichinella patagoniensis]|uniref:Uncharacterized protein n=1 Tax=Trichinella patagoniensis TaxID=990121 RepID=A0A0V0YQ74_9BILA|nr:hypothetical protein T12_12567 [Trichinella patagoniensis]